MPSTGPTEDRLAIRELCDAFGDAVMRLDATAWAQTWADDSEWSPAPGVTLQGRAAIVERWTGAVAALDFCSFFGTHGSLSVDGDIARGVFNREERLYFKNGDLRTIVGRYDDQYAKIGGLWLLSRRVSHVYRSEIVKGA